MWRVFPLAPNSPEPIDLASLLNLAEPPETAPAETPAEAGRPLKVLVTGAYGLIGNLLYQRLAAQPDRYETYGLVKDLQRSERSAVSPSFLELPEGRLRPEFGSKLTMIGVLRAFPSSIWSSTSVTSSSVPESP